MKRLQNDELVKLMGGAAMFNNESNYTLAGVTVTPDPTQMEIQEWDSDVFRVLSTMMRLNRI